MIPGTNDFFVTLGIAAGAASFVIGAFWKYEDVASPEAKQMTATWLKYRGSKEKAPSWANHVVEAFNRLFGVRHFTWKCFRRSCAVSTIAVFLMCLLYVRWHPKEVDWWFSFYKHEQILSPQLWLMHLVGIAMIATWVMFIVIFNCIPDYFSYMKSRRILQAMSNSKRFASLWLFVGLDTAISVAIFLVPFSSLCLLSPAPEGYFSDLFASITFGHRTSIFLYASLFVSAWAWLYAISATTARLAVGLFPGLMTKTTWAFDLEVHPIRSFGCIAGGIVFIAVVALEELARV